MLRLWEYGAGDTVRQAKRFQQEDLEVLLAVASQAIASGMTVAELHRRAVMTPYPTRVSDLTYMLAPLLDSLWRGLPEPWRVPRRPSRHWE